MSYLSEQARELPRELRLRLVREIAAELELPSIDVRRIEEEIEKEKEAEKEKPEERPRKVVVDLELLARYPLLDEARGVVSAFSFEELDKGVYDRAAERVLEAAEKGIVSEGSGDPLTELLSYPVAIAVVTYLGNDWLKRRYAYAEGRRVERLLVTDDPEVLEFIAGRLFKTVERAGSEDGFNGSRYGDYRIGLKE